MTGPLRFRHASMPAALEFSAAQSSDQVPCTPAQRGLWHALCGASLPPSHQVQTRWLHLRGELDRAALAAAVAELVARHDALRVSFFDDGRSMRFAPQRDVELRCHDLRRIDAPEREQALTEVVAAACRLPFELCVGPLLRATLLRLGDAEHRLLLVLHRLICDERSMGVLLADLGALYARQLGSGQRLLSGAGSFAAHARDCALRPMCPASQAFWAEQLVDAGSTDQPACRLDPDAPLPRAVRRALDPALVRAFDDCLRARGISARAGWLTLLLALRGAPGRAGVQWVAVECDAEAERWPVGMCAAVAPLQLPVDVDARFLQLAAEIESRLAEGARRSPPQVDDLLARLPLTTDLRWPFASMLFRLRRSAPTPVVFADLQAFGSDGQDDAAEFAASVTVDQADHGPFVEWRGGGNPVADAQQVSRLVALLQAVVIDPDLPLGQALAGLPRSVGADGRPAAATGALAAPPDRAPLSPDQCDCWNASRGQGGANHALAQRLRGPLDLERLLDVTRRVLQRQRALRVRLLCDGDGHWQQQVQTTDAVLASLRRALRVPEDLSRLSESEREAVLHERLHALADGDFPDDGSRLLRATLFRLAEREHVLVLVVHPVIADAESLLLLAAELAEAYRAAADQRPARLPELTLDPIARAHWHVEWLQGAEYEAQRSIWLARLADWQARERARLPRDCAARTEPGALHREALHLPGWLDAALTTLAASLDTTIDVLLLAAYAFWLARCSNATVAVVAVPVSSRDGEPLQHLAGPYTQWLPLALPIERPAAFLALAEATRDGLRALRAQPDLMHRHLLDADPLDPCRIRFCYRDLRGLPRQWGDDLEIEPLVLTAAATTRCELQLEIHALGDGTPGMLIADPGRFQRCHVAAFRDQWLSLLTAIADQPQQTLAELSRPAPLERERLQGWSHGRPAPEIAADSLTARFRRVCATHPGAPAVVDGERRLSYRQMSRAVANVAVRLRSVIARGDVLVVALADGAGRIAGVLAGLSVAARCLLLDPAAPVAGLRRALDASIRDERSGRRRRWLLADAALGRALRWPDERRIDPLWFERPADSRSELLRAPNCGELLVLVDEWRPTTLAMVPERSLLALASGLREHALFGPSSRVAASAHVHDAHHLIQTLLPLLDGGAVVFAAERRKLSDWLPDPAGDTTDGDAAINLLVADAGDWQRLYADGWRGDERLTCVIDHAGGAAGEAVPSGLCGRHFRAFGDLAAGVWSLFGPLEGVDRVLPARRVEIVDDDGEAVPIGVYGQLRLQADAHDGNGAVVAMGGPARWRADGVLERQAGAIDAARARSVDGASTVGPRPLFLLHDDSDAPDDGAELRRLLPDDLPCVAISIAPTGAPPGTLAELVQGLADAIRRRQPGGPYRLAGSATGARLALEVASALRADGEQVDLLAVLGMLEPRRPSIARRMHGALARWVEAGARSAATELCSDLARRASMLGTAAQTLAAGLGSSNDAAARRPQQRAWLLRALRRQPPARYDGEITVFAPGSDGREAALALGATGARVLLVPIDAPRGTSGAARLARALAARLLPPGQLGVFQSRTEE